MKRLCFVTAARSEYSLLKWLMKEVEASSDFELQLVVTGGHLLKEQGYTVDQIREDGFTVTSELDIQIDNSTKENIAASMGKMAEGMAHILAAIEPDYMFVLGDRYELLPICNTAFVMNIPIVHISGGDVTEGAIDDGVRNAVTMLATYHFPGTEDSAANICRMRGKKENIWAVGEPGLDSFNKESMMTREELAASLGLDMNKKWILMTYHPETRETAEYNLETVNNCCIALSEINDCQVVCTYANADFGGDRINECIEKKAGEDSDRFKCVPSLGSRRYLSLMKQVELVIGNSSSGIVEAPVLGIPVINIGKRQAGRYLCGNIISCGHELKDIREALTCAFEKAPDTSDSDHWGDGHTSERIMEIIRRVL